ncbi:Coxsackievirus and adenovirus receptor -like protein [Channa argus]|uniref:Coxsackievirus and adenovirus receptor-like protein n=1 Tax=Channa argus TaxID=215402 RepID=A0A6G1Q6W1_CHAAH|nr:Coxsackievirus and adenovirus receptor -like protein [Channa argus]
MSVSDVKTVQPGEDVLLLCLGPRAADIVFVEWIRPDLESEGSVFFFRDDRTYENYQHPSFHGRVELRDPQMKDGDASVILKNVTIKDIGTYECNVRITGNSLQFISSVHLKVKDSDHQQITVKTGDDVTLQCLDHRGGDIELLVWRRLDLEEDVFDCRHGSMSDNLQHPSFKNRVELRDPEMKDGDVSVILKKVKISDTGTYECYVRNSNTQPQPQLISNITMTVIDSGDGAGDTEDGGNMDRGKHGHVGLVVVTVLVVVVVIGFMIYRRCRRLNQHNHQCPADEAADHELQDLNSKPEVKIEEVEEEKPPVET